MPTFVLEIKAQLEEVESLTPVEGVLWKLDIENEASEVREGITVCETDEEQELDGSKGSAHFVMKWNKSDKYQAYIKIIDLKKAAPKKGKKSAGDDTFDGVYRSQNEEWRAVLCMECRGLKPTNYHLGNDFIAKSTGGTEFEPCEFGMERDGGEWAEYDEEHDLSVVISQVQSRIREV